MRRRTRAGADENADALLLFASETPAPATTPAPRVSTPPSAQPPKVAAGRDSYAQHPWRPLSAAFFAAALMTLAAGLVIGIARGYTNTQLPWLLSMTSSETAAAPAPASSVSTASSPGTTVQTPSSDPQPVSPLPGSSVPLSESTRELHQPADMLTVPPVTAATPPAVSDAAGAGSLDVISYPAGAVVSLDGRVVGQTPLVIRNVPQGTHVVGIEAPGLNRWAASMDVTAGERTRVAATLSE